MKHLSYRIILITIIIVPFLKGAVLAQSPLFSQYNTANLYTNPATVGMSGDPFIGKLGVRSQWRQLDGGYQSQYASIEFSTVKRVNLGALISNDLAGDGGLQTTNVSAIIGYIIPMNIKFGRRRRRRRRDSNLWYFQPAMQVGFTSKALRSGYISIDEVNNNLPSSNSGGLSQLFPELTLGFMMSNKTFWLGTSVHHILQSEEEVLDYENILQPPKMRYTVHAGVLKSLNNNTTWGGSSILRIQGGVYQGDFNFSAAKSIQHQRDNIVLEGSLGYRTLLDTKQENNRDAIIAGVNIRYKNLQFGYSRDFTISKLSNHTLGTDEISVVIYPSSKRSKRWKKDFSRKNRVKCPAFSDPRRYLLQR